MAGTSRTGADDDGGGAEAAGSQAGTSEAVTKTTLDDLFETLKKLEEDEQLATARPERKNAWCRWCYDMGITRD